MGNPHWILRRNPKGQLFGASVKRKGKVYHCTAVRQITDPAKLKGKASLCINSSKTVVEVGEFPFLKKDILQLQIKNRLEQLALFDVNEAINISYHVIQNQSQQQSLSIVAVPEELVVAGIRDVTQSRRVELLTCVSMAASIASLLKQLGSDAFIVLLLSQDKAYVLGVRDGIALFRQTIPLSSSGEVDPETASHAIGFGRQTLERDFGVDKSRFLCMGERKDEVEYEDLGEENWVPDWSHCLHVEGDDLLRYPAIFGTLFTSSSYSYLPEEYKRASRLRLLSRLLVIGAGIGAVVFSGLSYQNVQKLDPLRSQLQKERKEMSSDIATLKQQLPDPNNVEQVKAYLDIEAKAAVQPSVSLFLQQIAAVLPENVTLLTMKITRKSRDTEQESVTVIPVPGQSPDMAMELPEQGTQTKAEILLGQELVVHFNCASKGDYGRVKARFEEALKGFSSLFSLHAVDWGYEEKRRTGYLDCELLLTGEER